MSTKPRSYSRKAVVNSRPARPTSAKPWLRALALLLALATAAGSFAVAPRKPAKASTTPATPTTPDPSQTPASHVQPTAPHIPRPSPDFTYDGVGGKKSLRTLRGQPVILVIAKSPKAKIFRKQTELLDPVYTEFAGKKVVFVAAFSEAEGDIKSNIPFVLANNGPSVASAFDLHGDILVAVIGKDGNLDLITNELVPPWRMREVVVNSFEVQNFERKERIKGLPAPTALPAMPPAPAGVRPSTEPSPRPQPQ